MKELNFLFPKSVKFFFKYPVRLLFGGCINKPSKAFFFRHPVPGLAMGFSILSPGPLTDLCGTDAKLLLLGTDTMHKNNVLSTKYIRYIKIIN